MIVCEWVMSVNITGEVGILVGYLEIVILIARASRTQVLILLVDILPIIPRHAEFLKENRFTNLHRPLRRVRNEFFRKTLSSFQVRLARIGGIINTPILHPAVRSTIVNRAVIVSFLVIPFTLLALEANIDQLLGSGGFDVC
jgi:hypothetical protein